MAELPPLIIEYPAADPAAPPAYVERLGSEAITEGLAQAALRLKAHAYEAQFGGQQLPHGYATEYFSPANSEHADWQKRAQDRVARGTAQYWIARSSSGELRGFAQLCDSLGAAYLANSAVAPPWREGIGRRLMHARLAFGGYAPNSRVALDGYVGSSVNEWYERLGFEPRQEHKRVEIGERSMLAQRFVAPSTLALSGIVHQLEMGAPELARAAAHQSAEISA